MAMAIQTWSWTSAPKFFKNRGSNRPLCNWNCPFCPSGCPKTRLQTANLLEVSADVAGKAVAGLENLSAVFMAGRK